MPVMAEFFMNLYDVHLSLGDTLDLVPGNHLLFLRDGAVETAKGPVESAGFYLKVGRILATQATDILHFEVTMSSPLCLGH